MLRRRQLLGLVPAGALVGLLGCHPEPGFQATDLGASGIPGTFAAPLHDVRGRPRQLEEFRGRLVLLFFGYTQCPDICPGALARFAALLRQSEWGPERLQVIFVTLDPQRDTPARLADYVAWFHPDILALTGRPADLAAVTRQFRVTAVRRPVEGALGEVIDHSAGTYVLDRHGRVRLHVADNASLDSLRADLQRLLAEP